MIRFLVCCGVPHGDSGVSKEMLSDVNKYRNRWLTVIRGADSDGIEFYSVVRNSIPYVEIEHLLNLALTQVDDLI